MRGKFQVTRVFSSPFVPSQINRRRRTPQQMTPHPHPSLSFRLLLGSQRGFQSSPKGREEAANKAAVKPRTYATLPPEEGRGPGAASRFSPARLAPNRSPLRPPPPETSPSPARVAATFRLRAAGADSPSTPAPGPTSASGKNQPGGRGGLGRPEVLLSRGQP